MSIGRAFFTGILLSAALVAGGCGDDGDVDNTPDLSANRDFAHDACTVKSETYMIPYPALDGGMFTCATACKLGLGAQEQNREPDACKLLGDPPPLDVDLGDTDGGVLGPAVECVYSHACL